MQQLVVLSQANARHKSLPVLPPIKDLGLVECWHALRWGSSQQRSCRTGLRRPSWRRGARQSAGETAASGTGVETCAPVAYSPQKGELAQIAGIQPYLNISRAASGRNSATVIQQQDIC